MKPVPAGACAIAVLVLACIPSAESIAKTKRSPADQALYQKARQTCNGRQYPTGTRPIINYKGNWFRCQEPKWARD